MEVSVDYETQDGTAVGKPSLVGSHDYWSKSGTVKFAADTNVTQHIDVPVKGDSVYEGTEEFFVQLSNNIVANMGRDRATGTIEDNESKPRLAIDDTASVTEGDGGGAIQLLFFDVTLSGPTNKDVTFDYSTFDGSAHSNDYGAIATGSGKILAGQTSTRISVAITGDTRNESDENFFLTLSNVQNANLGNLTCEVTILDDE
jgi:hypothetical protein